MENQISELVKPEHTNIPYESKELGELFSALAKAQCEMSIALHNSNNPFFKLLRNE